MITGHLPESHDTRQHRCFCRAVEIDIHGKAESGGDCRCLASPGCMTESGESFVSRVFGLWRKRSSRMRRRNLDVDDIG